VKSKNFDLVVPTHKIEMQDFPIAQIAWETQSSKDEN